MKNLTILTLSALFLGGVAFNSVQAASKEEVSMCIETIEQMTGDKITADIKKLCEEGKLEEAIATAMGG